MLLNFSIIIPVYNRPDEVRELFQSLARQQYDKPFEVVLVEDGSSLTSEKVVDEFKHVLEIAYLFKPNSGPGDSRNQGMIKAGGNYFLILDSDCVLPPSYLNHVENALSEDYVDCFGGPDTADTSFTVLQRAINYSMTSFLTTGGIRGHKNAATSFQPRSFNMGLSKKAFAASGGFGNIHPGEDPDLSLRLKQMGYDIRLIPEAFVYHKRRISFRSFANQVYKFGLARPILNKWHKKSSRLTFWFPTFFTLGLLFAMVLIFIPWYWPIGAFGVYFFLILIDAWVKTRSLGIGLLALPAVMIQFAGYGFGFLKSIILINFSKKKPRELFPKLFFEPTKT
ncbi:MAG: glycosyltransferase [Flavobacteriaceae bacterium]